MNRQLYVVVAFVFWTARILGQSDLLDLTNVSPSGELVPEAFEFALGGTSHSASPTPSIELTLSDIGTHPYRMGESFTYRLRLRNVGQKSIQIPWELDWTRVIENPAYPVAGMVLGVAIRNDMLVKPLRLTSSVILYGSSSTPTTLKTLAPKASAEIVIPAAWRMTNSVLEAVVSDSLPRTTNAVAYLQIIRSPTGETDFSRVASAPVAVDLNRAASAAQ